MAGREEKRVGVTVGRGVGARVGDVRTAGVKASGDGEGESVDWMIVADDATAVGAPDGAQAASHMGTAIRRRMDLILILRTPTLPMPSTRMGVWGLPLLPFHAANR